MPKPGRIGRPPNQPTNHTLYGSWEGAQVLLLVLCGLPDLPYMGGRSLPTIFSPHLTILSATQPCIPPLACLRRTDPSPLLLFSSTSLTFDKVSTRNNPSSSKTPTRARFQGIRCTFLTSWAQLAREIVHLRAEIGSYMAVTARKIFRAAGGRQPTNQPHRCHLALSRTPLAGARLASESSTRRLRRKSSRWMGGGRLGRRCSRGCRYR